MKLSGRFIRQLSGFAIIAALLFAAVAHAQIVSQPIVGPIGSCSFLTSPPVPTSGQASMVWCPGGTSAKVLSTASTNATLIKNAPGILFDVHVVNTNAAAAYLKFYDLASAPTCNTTPVIATYPLVQNIPVMLSSYMGRLFATGIGLCITGAQADNDNTNATTGITVTLTYK